MNFPTQYWDLDESELPLLEELKESNYDMWKYEVLDSPPEWYWVRKATLLLGGEDPKLGHKGLASRFSDHYLVFEPKDSE